MLDGLWIAVELSLCRKVVSKIARLTGVEGGMAVVAGLMYQKLKYFQLADG